MPKHLVLDIGNVLCEWSPDALVASAFDDPAERAAALEATIGHPDWDALDRGRLETEDAVARAIARSGLDPRRIAAIYGNLPASLVPIEGAHAAAREAHAAGVPLYVLSNMHAEAWLWLQENHDVFGLCDGVVVSCEAGLSKPDPAIYRHLTDRFGLEPADCVFVDDVAANVEAAIGCGWSARRLAERERGGALVRELAAAIGADQRSG